MFHKDLYFVISEVSLDLSCALNVQPIQNYIQEHNIESWSFNYCSQRDTVSIMIRLWAKWSEVLTLVWTRDSSLLKNIQTCSRASLLVTGYQGSFLEVKQPGYEVNHSPPTSVKVKTDGSYTSYIICLHGMDGENFTFFSHRWFKWSTT